MALRTEAPTDIECIRPWRIWFALGILITVIGLALITTVAASLFGVAVTAVGLIVAVAAYSTRHSHR